MYGGETTWTDARIDILKTLWVQGMSASRIAAELGEVSRSSVLGKVHRLQLAKRRVMKPPGDRKPRVHKRQRFREVPPMKPVFEELRDHPPKVDSAALAAELFMQPGSLHSCTLMDLTPDTCRWPVGDPGQPDFFFCGGKSVEGLPYCAFHSRMAYQRRSVA